MARALRSASSGLLALGLSIAGAAAAHAWTWATASSPIVMSGGAGYGNLVYSNYNHGVLQVWLKDSKLDGKRIYAHVYADYKSDFTVESGRRTDGGATFARMADKSFASAYPYGVQQYFYTVELCRDEPFLDPCSDSKRYHQGL